MKVRMNLHISPFRHCRVLFSEGSFRVLRVNYASMQITEDTQKMALEGQEEALRRKKRRINSTTGSTIITPTTQPSHTCFLA